MAKLIMFSLVGMSDPIRGNFDGPLLNIARHLKPEIIYLFHTAETSERDRLDNRYELSLKSINKNINVFKIFTDIANVHLYEELSVRMKKEFYQVCEKHLEDDIIVNLTSGTQQMTGILSLLIATGIYNVGAYQVSTPENKSNTNISMSNNYDVFEQIKNNFDSDSEFSTNRLIKTDLMQYKRTLIYSQIKSLIENHFDYNGSIQILSDSQLEVSSKLRNLLILGKYRLMLMKEKTLNIINSNKFDLVKFSENEDFTNLVEYFQIIKIKQKTGNYAEMVLMFEPFTVKLQESFIKYVLDVNFKSWIDRRGYLVKKRISKYSPEVFNDLDNAFSGSYSESYPSVSSLKAIIQSLISSKKQTTDFTDFITTFDVLSKLKELRNDLAHDLRSTDAQEIDKQIGISHLILIDNIENLIKNYFKVSYKYFEFYENLNKMIKEEMKEIL